MAVDNAKHSQQQHPGMGHSGLPSMASRAMPQLCGGQGVWGQRCEAPNTIPKRAMQGMVRTDTTLPWQPQPPDGSVPKAVPLPPNRPEAHPLGQACCRSMSAGHTNPQGYTIKRKVRREGVTGQVLSFQRLGCLSCPWHVPAPSQATEGVGLGHASGQPANSRPHTGAGGQG